MKAFLLAAGLGTRLRPLTDHTPKCLVEVGGRALLDIWLDALAGVGVDEVLVNTHHLADQVEDHVARRTSGPARAPRARARAARQRGDAGGERGPSSPERTCSSLSTPTTSPTSISACWSSPTAREVDPPRSASSGPVAPPSAASSRCRAASWSASRRSRPVPAATSPTRVSTPSRPRSSTSSRVTASATSASTCCLGWWAGPGP